jgi:hypothetical protein
MSKNRSTLMVLNRRANLASTLGHIISFYKDVPVAVPPILFREAVNMGAVPADKTIDVAEKVAEDKAAQPIDPSERLDDVRAAIDEMVAENSRDDFTAASTPKVANVSKRVGYKVDGTEVRTAWDMRSLDLAEENDT